MTASVDMKPGAAFWGLLERGGALTAATILAVVGVGWIYLVAGAGMEAPSHAGATVQLLSTATHAALILVMWMVMMTAMMLPSAAPMILLYRSIARKRFSPTGYAIRVSIIAGGYLLAWAVFSIPATATHWGLHESSMLGASSALSSKPASAALLLLAGLYQLSPLKHACLRQCRSPLAFLAQSWRDDLPGVLGMGLRHGLYCVGCCWALMALLFVGGVMNILWAAGLTVWVLLEKVAPHGRLLGRLAGFLLIAAAIASFAA